MEEYYKSLKPEAQERYLLKLQCAGLYLEEDPYLIKDYSKDTTRDRLGEGCFHVAVIMFKVEAGVRLGCTSCTSQQCSWNETHTDKVNLYIIVKILLFSTFRLNHLLQHFHDV